jgi:hypothetical protein
VSSVFLGGESIARTVETLKNFPDTDLSEFHNETFLGSIPLVGVTCSGQNKNKNKIILEFPMSKTP